MPPLVTPIRYPEDILRSVFTVLDYEAMYKFLEEYGKKHPEWDSFRSKIPEPLLEKWLKVLGLCRENGFIAPYTKDSKIVFHQVLTPNRLHADKCSMCANSFQKGTCKGKLVYENHQRLFKTCWGIRPDQNVYR